MSDDLTPDIPQANSGAADSSNSNASASGPSRRTFLKQAALGTAAVLAFPSATVLGANDRVRVGMIGVGDRGSELLRQVRGVSWCGCRGHG